MPKANYPSIDLIRQSLRYDDGKLFWLTRPPEHFKNPDYAPRINKRSSGKEAGCKSEYKDKHGKIHKRWVIRIFDIKLYRYQIVWALEKNEWLDEGSIDHEDRNTLNDKIGNLRLADKSKQGGNCGKRSHNTTGYKGVIYDKRRKKYIAQIIMNGKHKYIGQFDNPEDAHAAYCEVAKKHFGEFFHDGKDPD